MGGSIYCPRVSREGEGTFIALSPDVCILHCLPATSLWRVRDKTCKVNPDDARMQRQCGRLPIYFGHLLQLRVCSTYGMQWSLCLFLLLNMNVEEDCPQSLGEELTPSAPRSSIRITIPTPEKQLSSPRSECWW